MRIFLFFILLPVLCIETAAQDLSGTWEGNSTNSASYMKLVIVRQNNTYIGYSYDAGDGFCKANFIGEFDEAQQVLTGKGISFIEQSGDHGLMRFRLKYEKKDGTHYLVGTTASLSLLNDLFSLGTDKALLKRTAFKADTTFFMRDRLQPKTITQPTDTVQPENKTNPVIPSAKEIEKNKDRIVSAKEKRSVDTISTIITPEKTITISIFDNGQVDGDTITVFHNNEILLANHFVSAVPYRITITNSQQQSRHEIMLVANNLGSIPPNTAVLNVEAGDKRYRLSASADLSKNVLLIIEFRE